MFFTNLFQEEKGESPLVIIELIKKLKTNFHI